MPLFRAIAMATTVFFIDRISKWIVIEYMDLPRRIYIEAYPPYINFVMGWNEGINFGLFGSNSDVTRYFLITLALVIIIGLVIWVRKQDGWLVPLSVGAIIGGAMGNVLDRMIYGAVADFLNMSCCGLSNPYAFNTADIAIFAGAFGLIFFGDPKKKH